MENTSYVALSRQGASPPDGCCCEQFREYEHARLTRRGQYDVRGAPGQIRRRWQPNHRPPTMAYTFEILQR